METLYKVISVITLCRDNPAQLHGTLAALPAAVEGLVGPWEVLVLDGSDDEVCAEVVRTEAMALNLPLRYVRRPARGIYAAMNEALDLVDGDLVAFMNAGDHYLPTGLTALVQHWQGLVSLGRARPVAVFGQAWVQPSGPAPAWLTPDPMMTRLERWLRGMVPCHQAFVFERDFSRANLYSVDSLVADRTVMRAALAATGPGAYLRKPVCVYDLTGVSSSLPSAQELCRRLRDPNRTALERAAELGKALLRPFIGAGYPILMRCRSQLWGWCCR